VKNRRISGSSTHSSPPTILRFSCSHVSRSIAYFTCESVKTRRGSARRTSSIDAIGSLAVGVALLGERAALHAPDAAGDVDRGGEGAGGILALRHVVEELHRVDVAAEAPGA